MKTTPLLALAVTVIAGMLLSSCSLISGRHYNLNLVKVEKNKLEHHALKKTENSESNDLSLASIENFFVPNEILSSSIGSINKLKNSTKESEGKTIVLSQKIKHKKYTVRTITNSPKNKINYRSSSSIDPFAVISFISGIISALLIFALFSATSFIFFFLVLTISLVASIIAIITGIIGLISSSKEENNSLLFSVLGVAIGSIVLLIFYFLVSRY